MFLLKFPYTFQDSLPGEIKDFPITEMKEDIFILIFFGLISIPIIKFLARISYLQSFLIHFVIVTIGAMDGFFNIGSLNLPLLILFGIWTTKYVFVRLKILSLILITTSGIILYSFSFIAMQKINWIIGAIVLTISAFYIVYSYSTMYFPTKKSD